MRRTELTQGRTFGVVFDLGEDFFTALADFCAAEGVRQGYIPMFLAAFSSAELVGTCERVEDPAARWPTTRPRTGCSRTCTPRSA
jgi:predicted DNA-binding protein with PD1-like motif